MYPLFINNGPAMALLDTSSVGMFNTQWNLARESIFTNNMMFMMPNPAMSCYPFMNNCSFNLPDPKEWAKQMWANRPDWMQHPQFNFGGMATVGTTNPGASTSNGKEKEYNDIKNLLIKLNALNNDNGYYLWDSDELKDKVSNAISKTGTVDERLEAVRDALKSISENPGVKDEITKITLQDAALRLNLYKSGFNFEGDNDYFTEEDLNALATSYPNEVTSKLESVNGAVNELKSYNGADETDFANASIMAAGGSNGSINRNILADLSALNRAAESTTYIELLMDALGKAKNEGPKDGLKKVVTGMNDSLVAKANGINKNTLGSTLKTEFNNAISELSQAHNELKAAIDEVAGNENVVDAASRTKFADAFNNLYKMIRLIEAKKIDNTIESKTSYLGKISEGLAPDKNIIVEATKQMLESEHIDVGNIDLSEVKGTTTGTNTNNNNQRVVPNSPEAKIQKLGDNLTKVADTDPQVYRTSNDYSTLNPQSFYVVQGSKLIELKGAVRYVPNNEEFVMEDDSTATLSELIEANKNNDDVSVDTIKQTTKFRQKIGKYRDEGKLFDDEVINGTDKPIFVNSDGEITYVALNNKLYEIEGCKIATLKAAAEIDFEDNKAYVDGTEYDLKQVNSL